MRTTIACALVIALVLLANTPATRQSTDDLEQRMEQLEKAVLKDSYHPERTMVYRLANIEKTIESLEKARNAAGSEARDNEARGKRLTDLEKQSNLLQQRIKTMEDQLSRNDPREVQRGVAQLKHDLDRMETRLRQLEAK